MSEPIESDLHPHADVHLDVEREGGAPYAVLTIRNTSEREPLELVSYCLPDEGLLDADVFVIRAPAGARYLGMATKRAAPAEEEFVILAPGEVRRWRVALGDHYAFDQEGAATITYQAWHSRLTPPATVWRLRSNSVDVG